MSPKWQTPPPNLLALHSNNMHIYVGVKVRKPTCVVAIFTASLWGLSNFWEVTCSIFWWLYFDNLGWCLGDYRVTQFASTCFIRQQLAGIKWNENTRFGRESLSCCCIYNDGVCTVEFTKKDILGLVAESSITMKIVATLWCLLLVLRCLFVPWGSSCSGTWGWCPGSSACARKCFGTCPSPLSPAHLSNLRSILKIKWWQSWQQY